MTQPNFLIIGAAKAGTSSLYHYLKQHPQVYMSPVKEPRYFAPELYTDYQKDPFRDGAKEHRDSPMSAAEYASLFSGVTHEVAIGEASTEYLYVAKTPERIKEALPNVKLIAVLRDPAERAYSAYCYQLRDGCERGTFEQALEEEEYRRTALQRWPGWLYQRMGFYYPQIKRYLDCFEREQIRIYLYEDLKQDSQAVVQDALKFLCVDASVEVDLTRKNVSAIPKSRVLQNLLIKENPIKTVLRPLMPAQLRTAIRQQNLSQKPAMAKETRQQLVNLYSEDILKLQSLIGRDLSSWLAV